MSAKQSVFSQYGLFKATAAGDPTTVLSVDFATVDGGFGSTGNDATAMLEVICSGMYGTSFTRTNEIWAVTVTRSNGGNISVSATSLYPLVSPTATITSSGTTLQIKMKSNGTEPAFLMARAQGLIVNTS